MSEVASTFFVMYELNLKVFGLKEDLLSMCGVMGFQLCIELVDKDWHYEQGLIMMYMMKSQYMCKLV